MGISMLENINQKIRTNNIYEQIYKLKNESSNDNFILESNNKEFLVNFFGLLTEFISLIPTDSKNIQKDQMNEIKENINNLNEIKTNISSYINLPIKTEIINLIDSIISTIDNLEAGQQGGYRVYRRNPRSKKLYQYEQTKGYLKGYLQKLQKLKNSKKMKKSKSKSKDKKSKDKKSKTK